MRKRSREQKRVPDKEESETIQQVEQGWIEQSVKETPKFVKYVVTTDVEKEYKKRMIRSLVKKMTL